MASKFAGFVEFCTDSRYVPLGTRCALWNKKLGFFRTGFWSINAGKLADGTLCEKCNAQTEYLLTTKRDWMKPGVLRKAAWNVYNTRNKEEMPLNAVKEMFSAKEAADAERLSSFGNDKTALYQIKEAVQIEPSALQVGIARAKRLTNKAAVFGTVERGSFSKGASIQIEQNGVPITTVILEAYVYDCDENTLEVNLRANMGKPRLSAGQSGWLVLDYENDVALESYIAC